jgi:transcriptional regulator with XRE-family HTH domain
MNILKNFRNAHYLSQSEMADLLNRSGITQKCKQTDISKLENQYIYRNKRLRNILNKMHKVKTENYNFELNYLKNFILETSEEIGAEMFVFIKRPDNYEVCVLNIDVFDNRETPSIELTRDFTEKYFLKIGIDISYVQYHTFQIFEIDDLNFE